MKKIFILHQSKFGFDLDIDALYQPLLYTLYLITDHFGLEYLKKRAIEAYFERIDTVDRFDMKSLLPLIQSSVLPNDEINVITNSEQSISICGKIRKKLGLDPEDYTRFHDKHEMKKRLSARSDLLSPNYRLFDSAAYQQHGTAYLQHLIDDIHLPLFIKPTDNAGSRHLAKITTLSEFSFWADQQDDDTLFEVDEFIDGTMYHCDAFIQHHRILFSFVSQNSRPCYDFTIGQMKGTIVLPETHPDAITIAKKCNDILQTLGTPKSGVTHMEVIKTASNAIYFIEVAHRAPGCLIPKMYERHAGININTEHLLLQIDPEHLTNPDRQGFAAWSCYPKKPGTVTQIKSSPTPQKSQYEFNWLVEPGDTIQDYSQFGRDFTGTLLMWHDQFDALYREFIEANQHDLCLID